MKPELWKIFSKQGDNLNLTGDSYLNMIFSTSAGKNAQGYAITDPSLQIVRTYIADGGWNYDTNTQLFLEYTFAELPYAVDASIFYQDVSIFNPEPSNSSSVSTVNIIDSSNYIYPSVTYAGALFLDPVSQGLIETEHLIFFEESSIGYVTPYDTSNSELIFRMVGDEDQIRFFTIDDASQEIIWSDELIYDVSEYTINQGIQINVGFTSEEEGVYERRLVVNHKVGENEYPLMELVVNAQSIGQDERFDTLLENFGLYKPKSFPKLFKESDINEDLPDWELLNYKAKHMILDHNQIMPYIGTYKGLINAIKWLGYEDIQVKEWFKNVKENKKLSLHVPYDADGRKKTIKYFSPEERKHLKKLNQLSLVYCITKETGELDNWGTPITENCYEYNLNEILIKLFALKKWLEKNIIGVNARIYDLTGEGIYFERFQNFIYGTQNIGNVANYEQSLTPLPIFKNSELVNGDTSILLTLKESNELTIQDLNTTFINFARYGWDPSNGYFSPDEYSNLSYSDPSAVFIGSPFSAPFVDLYDIQWKLLLEKENGVLTNNFVTNPLFIYENEIKFYNNYDTSTSFYDSSVNLDVTIETGYLRDPSNDNWSESLAYSIYQEKDASNLSTGKWVFESSTGIKTYTWGEFSLQTDASSSLIYELNNDYKASLFNIGGFKWTDASGSSYYLDKNYILDIVDGKIAMQIDASMTSDSILIGDNIPNDSSIRELTILKNFINFNYDTSLLEQQVNLNVTYTSPRMPIFTFDPSDVSLLYYNPDASIELVDDNSIYKMNVNHAGDYTIQINGWNGQNNAFFNYDRNSYSVWQKYPTINSYIDTSCAGNLEYACTSTYITSLEVSTLINENLYPIFDRIIPLQGLTLEYDVDNNPFIQVPSITYFQDIPEINSISKFYNLTERITSISGSNIIIDEDYQNFYKNDLVNIVQFDKGKYSFIQEASASIITATSPNFVIDNAPSNFSIDSSTEWYLLNDTQRSILNGTNDLNNRTFTCDISTYSFDENQLVAILINDQSTGYIWGSSFRVLDVSTTYNNSYGYQHIFEGNVPEFIVDNPGKYNLTAKHAFSTFVDIQINVKSATERNNLFKIYLDDIYDQQYYLDNTFVFLNILFDQEKILEQWYDPSDNLIGTEFYPFDYSIKLDVSTLVILKTEYADNNYMLNQKNIWTINKQNPSTGSNELIMRVHNFSVPYIFDEIGDYDITVESYDSFGNLKKQTFEGLISIKDEN